MRVLNISYSDSQGGAAIAAMQWHKMLCDIDGIHSELWVCDKQSNQADVFDKRKWWAKCIGLKPFKAFSVYVSKLITYRSKAKGLTTLQYLSQLSVDEINAGNFDVVHLHWIGFETLSCKGMLALKSKLIITMHDNWFFNAYHHLGVVHGFENSTNYKRKALLFKNDENSFVALSTVQKNQANQSQLISKSKIQTIGHFVDETVFGNHIFDNEISYILVGGSFPFQKEKGGDDLEHFIEICQSKGIQLKIFGTTEISKNGSVEYLGTITKHQLAKSMANATVYINFSHQESFSLTTLEALACGTPVLGRRVGAIPEMVIEGQTGFLFNSIEEVLNLYLHILSKPKKEWQMACKKQYSDNFSKAIIQEKAKTLYGL